MNDFNFLNSDKYITARILEIKGITKLLSSEVRNSSVGPEATRVTDFEFDSISKVVLRVSVHETGFTIITFILGKEYFKLNSFLQRYDLATVVRYEKILQKCREVQSFQSNVELILNFLIDYINNSEDLQLVMEGKKWFNIPYDFGGLR